MNTRHSTTNHSTISRLADFFLLPAKHCKTFFVVGILAWILVFELTNWTSDSLWVWLPALVGDLYVLTLIVCLLPRKWRGVTLLLFYLIVYISGFTETYIYQRYYCHITPQTLAMLTETTPEETRGFLNLCISSSKFWQTLAWWGGLLVFHIAIQIFCRKIRLQEWVERSLTVVVALCLIKWVPTQIEIGRFLSLDQTAKAERINYSVFHSTQWRMVYALKFDRLTQCEMQTLAHNMKQISVGESKNGVPYIVLVVGESYNKHHSAVYGYALPTTPFQCEMVEGGNMVAMSNAVTPWNVTSMVFKQMFSTRSSDEKAPWTDGVLFPAILRKGGYRVSFFSNQFYKSNRQTTADYNGSFFLNKQPFDSLCFDSRNTKHYLYDMGLLREIPEDPLPEKQFIILHLLGQHQPYADRIPKNQGVFKVDDIKRRDLTREERQIVADYDNATLINDRVLQKVYQRFADKKAVIIYVADHGEEVYDGNIKMFGRNHSAQPSPQIMHAEFEVPLEFFVTPLLKKDSPQLIAALREAQEKPCSIDDLPHTIIRLAGIDCKYYNPQRDILSPKFKKRPRKVKNLNLTYDDIINQKK